MRQALVAGNWKMNGRLADVRELVNGLKQGMDTVEQTEVVVCPPYIHLSVVAGEIEHERIGLGAQNLSQYEAGAYTGEVSGAMLKDYHCSYVLVGHSERRSLYGESNELVAEKFARAQTDGLKPVLCVGETLEERELDQTEEIISRQLRAVLDRQGGEGLDDAVIAYEPVWAIGSGLTATPQQAQEVHAYIRKLVAEYSVDVSHKVRILYGGSVKAENAETLFMMSDIDGGLIGGASLNADDFLTICRAAEDK